MLANIKEYIMCDYIHIKFRNRKNSVVLGIGKFMFPKKDTYGRTAGVPKLFVSSFKNAYVFTFCIILCFNNDYIKIVLMYRKKSRKKYIIRLRAMIPI